VRKLAISQPRVVRFRSNLVQSPITWHPIYNKRSRSSVKGHGYSVKTSTDRQVSALFEEIGVAKSNDDVGVLIRSLIRSLEIAVCAHAQCKIGQKQFVRNVVSWLCFACIVQQWRRLNQCVRAKHPTSTMWFQLFVIVILCRLSRINLTTRLLL